MHDLVRGKIFFHTYYTLINNQDEDMNCKIIFSTMKDVCNAHAMLCAVWLEEEYIPSYILINNEDINHRLIFCTLKHLWKRYRSMHSRFLNGFKIQESFKIVVQLHHSMLLNQSIYCMIQYSLVRKYIPKRGKMFQKEEINSKKMKYIPKIGNILQKWKYIFQKEECF